MTVIAADIGATKTLVAISRQPGMISAQWRITNDDIPDAAALLRRFSELAKRPDLDGITVSLALAGPVKNGHCQMTNRDWTFDATALKRYTNAASIHLQNDLAATASAMPALHAQGALEGLNEHTLNLQSAITVISVGTGLGEALLLPSANATPDVRASEGGHKNFAPFDPVSAQLLCKQLENKTPVISREDWLSGRGLPVLYRALNPDDSLPDAATITAAAHADPNGRAAECIRFFVRGMYAEAGDLALQYWSEGGVIFAGGVAIHLANWLRQPSLQHPFSAKAAHQEWLGTVPLALCTAHDAALTGALVTGWAHHGRDHTSA